MYEFHITVDAPELVNAINRLADALGSAPIPQAVSVNTAPEPENTPVADSNPTPPVQAAPAQVVPSAPAPSEKVEAPTLDAISRAGAALCESGKMPQLIELLGRYNVQAVTQLKGATQDTLIRFAEDLRALGAEL